MSRALGFLSATLLCVLCVLGVSLPASAADEKDWSSTVKFPESEKPVKLINGKELEGWEGNTGEGGTQKYFSVKDGEIVAHNEKENAPKVSNYLLTKNNYRNFRLVF